MLDEVKNISAAVEKVLKHDLGSRVSDQRLILKIWESEGLALTDEQRKMIEFKCSKPESIRRTRQKIQESGFYRPSDQVRRQRTQEEEKMRNFFSGRQQLI